MRKSFKTLLPLFIIPFLIFTYHISSHAAEDSPTPVPILVPTQEKDIRIIENPHEFGRRYDKRKSDKYKVINVSTEDIITRMLNGEPVYFVEDQEDEKRKIKPEWITDALKRKNGVDKIDIGNAIIVGDLDFRIEENLVDIDKTGIEADIVKRFKDKGIAKAYLVLSSISIENCKLDGILYTSCNKKNKYKSLVILKKNVEIYLSTEVMADFSYTTFNGDANFHGVKFKKKSDFSYTTFNGDATFKSATFIGDANFYGVNFKKKSDFSYTTFNGDANFIFATLNPDEQDKSVTFNGDATFKSATFIGDATFYGANFKEKADFSYTTFIGSANLNGATFNGDAKINSATFNEKVLFRSVVFNGNVSFAHTNFLDNVDFSNTLLGTRSSYVQKHLTKKDVIKTIARSIGKNIEEIDRLEWVLKKKENEFLITF